ncbi:ATP-binding protein [Mesorhizobium sp.]|uniref:ATP-binding protein n=1 Tax=Mesorhizobium sp. TaxID=1871066 RepID=UPI000FE3D013|nr:ATP-binding protein [Mesorhizobium sp.]RWN51708.1 MAG: ATP-binding protein [Mesorhizobium sp.]RWN72489.1 MAG: ATP-binding protein [Mesorhizobium sp.]RWN74025.1 MAG: ATP-binding protein [Mesorhizobium sp.]RWN83072.1 MAG: ATP-binding protein [Mesorhizobium sp.]RWO09371.1 MAG: ATP-binding protein [Mesorhizobium sp.]
MGFVFAEEGLEILLAVSTTPGELQEQSLPLLKCWPLDPDGPLPPQLIDTDIVRSAMFETLPALRKWPTSSVRQALKHNAKRLGLPVERTAQTSGDLQPLRDRALVRAFADSPIGRAQLPSIEVYVDDFARGRQFRRSFPIESTLPDLIWSWYCNNPAFDALTKWALDVSIPRPDLNQKGYFITFDVFAGAAVDGKLPTPVEDLNLGSALLLFASKLPRDEAIQLLGGAAELGVICFSELRDKHASIAPAGPVDSPAPGIELMPQPQVEDDAQRATQWEFRPRLIMATLADCALPELAPARFDMIEAIEILRRRKAEASDAEEAVRGLPSTITIAKIVALPSSDYDEFLSVIKQVRTGREQLATELEARRAQVRRQLERTLGIVQAPVAGWLAQLVDQASPDQLCDLAIRIDGMDQLVSAPLTPHEQSLWAPIVAQAKDFHQLVDAYRRLPSLRAEISAHADAEAAFVAEAKVFLKASPPGSAAEWLSGLSSLEVASLLRHMPARQWSVQRSLLFRLGFETGAAFIDFCQRTLADEEDLHARRAALTFFNPASVAIDQHPVLQRLMAAERFLDLIKFGPLAAITDPTSRLGDAELVGNPIAELVGAIVRHLDVVGAGAELKRLARVDRPLDDGAAQALLVFATTSLGSANIYYQLKEIAREQFFAPIVHGGKIVPAEAMRLAKTFNVEDALSYAVETIKETVARSARVEKRHEAPLERYLRIGGDLLNAYAAVVRPDAQSRRRAFKRSLVEHVSTLSTAPGSRGGKAWLEQQIRSMLLDPVGDDLQPTLLGDATPLSQQYWTEVDSLRVQESLLLPEFYLEDPLTRLDVCALSLRCWAADESPTASIVVEELLTRERYPAAISLVEQAALAEDVRTALRDRVTTSIAAAAAPLRQQLAELETRFGEDVVAASIGGQGTRAALDRTDLADARAYLELAELELTEAEERGPRPLSEAPFDPEANELLRILLKAGVEGVSASWTAKDLEARWLTELQQRVGERSHLLLVERAFHPALDNPAIGAEVRSFVAQTENPDLWLPADRARDLMDLLETPAGKLRTWIESSAAFEARARTSIEDIVRWFQRFIVEQSTTLKAIGEGEDIYNVLEHVLEASDCIDQSPDPVSCFQALIAIGEVEEGSPDEMMGAAISAAAPSSQSPELAAVVEKGNWAALSATCRGLRSQASQEEARRLDDLAEFGDTLLALEKKNAMAAAPGLVGSARLLGAGGQVVSRALPLKRQLDIAARFLAAALAAGQSPGAEPANPAPDGSWAPLFGRRGELIGVLQGASQATKVLEQLCMGVLGRDVIDLIWEAPTKTADPGQLRAAFLTFLHDNRLDEHILFLAQRHDPGIRPRLGQLLELRAVAAQRPDLIPMSEAVAEQVAGSARTLPFRLFVKSLPSAGTSLDVDLDVEVEKDIILRFDQRQPNNVIVAVSVRPRGMVPERLEFNLFPEDDVSFTDGSRRLTVSDQPIYMPGEWSVTIAFGESWRGAEQEKDSFRLRASARLLTGELVNRDVLCSLMRVSREASGLRRIDNETLLDTYPGVESTPAQDDAFIGRFEELEQLTESLVAARRPSPVLLTGMRRIGKTSLLYAFHAQHRRLVPNGTVTVYFSIAEKRAALMDPERDVGSVIYSTILHALSKRRFGLYDHNRHVGEKLQQHFGGEKDAVRKALADLREPDSLADSLILLSEALLKCLGGVSRVVYLIDEAETLVLPYRAGGAKRLELEQFLQSMREVSQSSPAVGLLLSGSNHIAEFAKSYKNAFFGSSRQVELGGIFDYELARRMVAPDKLQPYVRFDAEAVRYAIYMCAGMPQFMWQVGAATTALVRSGPVTRSDVRRGVAAIIADRISELPFKAYNVLEPIEHMLGLQGEREQDLLWLLLWRVANSSSLVADEAQQHFIIDQSLLELDDPDVWKHRLIKLVDLNILEMPRQAMYRFRVPIFAEGFRAPRHRQNYNLRHQRAGA